MHSEYMVLFMALPWGQTGSCVAGREGLMAMTLCLCFVLNSTFHLAGTKSAAGLSD